MNHFNKPKLYSFFSSVEACSAFACPTCHAKVFDPVRMTCDNPTDPVIGPEPLPLGPTGVKIDPKAKRLLLRDSNESPDFKVETTVCLNVFVLLQPFSLSISSIKWLYPRLSVTALMSLLDQTYPVQCLSP